MKYQCPSCFMQWEDELKPLEAFTEPTCVFCSHPHTQKELLNWQIDHLENISPTKFPFILRYLYRFFDQKISLLEEKYEQKKES